MRTIKVQAEIRDNALNFFNPSVSFNTIEKFKENNNKKKIEIKFKVISDVAYYIHEYYRGYLLPDITAACGEHSQERIHLMLKWEYMGIKCYGIEDVPKETKRDQLVIERGMVIGYVPSMAKITQSKAKKYILFCEHRLFVDLGSHIGASVADKYLKQYSYEANSYRKKIKW